MTHCEMCGDAPASVSTRDWALCKPCFYELRRQEQEDNPVANGPTCPVDGSVLSRHGTCTECYTRNVLVAHAGRAS